MSVIKEMDAIHNSSSKSDQIQCTLPYQYNPSICRNNSYTKTMFEVFQSLRKDEVLCDIRLQTDNGTVIFGHRIVLVSASPYFCAMFNSNSYNESNKDLIIIRDLDSITLQLLIDYIYTGEIIVNEENIQDLLPAANFLQLDYVKGVCADFLQRQMNPSNSIGIKLFAEHYNCMKLVSSSEAYIQKHFSEVVKNDEFLSLSFEEVIKLISCNDLSVLFEGEVFECVINWVKHELDCRYDSLPKLMEHVRLSLASIKFISEKVVGEPLLENSPKCKDFVIEAFHFHLLKTNQLITIPQTIRNTPRQPTYHCLDQVLVLSHSPTMGKCNTSWYDAYTNVWYAAPEMSTRYFPCTLALIGEHFVFALGNMYGSRSVVMLDLSLESSCWVSTVDMLVGREKLGVGILDNCIYSVGGRHNANSLNSAEVFDLSIKEWSMISSMSIKRCRLGVGIINNLVYAVGGFDGSFVLKSVECYDPNLNTWSPVTEMSENRCDVTVGVLDGVMYAVGGFNGFECLKSVEAYNPSTGVWTSIADMHFGRSSASIFELDRLLYVMGGKNGSDILDSMEIYDPTTNTWSVEFLSKSEYLIYGAVVVDRPPYWI